MKLASGTGLLRTLATLTGSPSGASAIVQEYHRRLRQDRDPVVLWDTTGPYLLDADLVAAAA